MSKPELEMVPTKTIVLLLDGTWNDSEADGADTNIVRLRELIYKSLDSPIEIARSAVNAIASNRTFTFTENGKKKRAITVVYYDRGVGTGGFFDKWLGGALGAGLEQSIRRAYRFLAQNYAAGDRVFVLGFSRGAYTARSLIGFVASAGLLRAENCSPLNESKVWYRYRTRPKERFARTTAEIELNNNPAETLIECVALFDTVGARGIPIRWFWRENRDLFEFHDVELSSICKKNLQALAIDEHRISFEAAIWRTPKTLNISSETEQVWFPGSHADVGGGYVDEDDRTAKAKGGTPGPRETLDDISLDWIIRRLTTCYPSFPLNRKRLHGKDLDANWVCNSRQHEPRRRLYRIFPFAWRSIGNKSEKVIRFKHQRYVSHDRHADSIGEAVHISALERIGHPKNKGSWWPQKFKVKYKPRNLLLALDQISRTYPEVAPTSGPEFGPLFVVDWTGEVLSNSDKASGDRVRELIAQIIPQADSGQVKVSTVSPAVPTKHATAPTAAAINPGTVVPTEPAPETGEATQRKIEATNNE